MFFLAEEDFINAGVVHWRSAAKETTQAGRHERRCLYRYHKEEKTSFLKS
jgi:hypothetical protein